MRACFALVLIFVAIPCRAADDLKKAIDNQVLSQTEQGWEAACKIWEWAEPGYQETRSSALLADMLKSAGFQVNMGVAEIPTAFTATIGTGKPVIGIMGEYDALPGLAQNAVPYRDPKAGGYYGHGCGHHLFGVASAMGAISLGEQIKSGKLKGTVRYYGCPAEEGGSAKVFMVQAGLFDDVDVALHWHPSNQNAAGDRTSLARIAVKFRFRGKSAHAAGAPEQGRSALDAVELTNYASELMREHTPDGTRIHHVITSGGDAPNVVPNFAEVYYYVRHPRSEVVRSLYARLVKCAQAGALATETELEIVNEGGIVEILPNNALAQVCLENLRALNDLKYDSEQLEFALKIQESMEFPRSLDLINHVLDKSGEIGMGSTDVGDVSWVVPTTGFNTACWIPGTPGHSWQAVACGRNEMARNGMVLAARVIAATAYDIMIHPETIERARLEHQRRLGTAQYKSLMEPGQRPPLNYRNRPTSANAVE